MWMIIQRMETDAEIRDKALVHWRCWQEVYPGIVSQAYLEKMTLEKCEEIAFKWKEGILVAKEEDRVIGFLGYGNRGAEAPGIGEVFALYVLPEYHGKGVGLSLMKAGIRQLAAYDEICLWVLKENARAIRFYEKCGFVPDGAEKYSEIISAAEIRMVYKPCFDAAQNL